MVEHQKLTERNMGMLEAEAPISPDRSEERKHEQPVYQAPQLFLVGKTKDLIGAFTYGNWFDEGGYYIYYAF